MNLNEGLTKIIKEYRAIREYANIKNKESEGLVDPEMENEKTAFSNFLDEFKQCIDEIIVEKTQVQYNIGSSTFAQAADIVPYITIKHDTNETEEKYNLAYLFKPESYGAYLVLGLEVNRLKNSEKQNFDNGELNRLRNIANEFRNHVQNGNLNSDEDNFDFNRFETECDLESNANLAKAYGAGTIFCRHYDFDEDQNIFLPDENELEDDLVEFIKLYEHFRSHNEYFNDLIDTTSTGENESDELNGSFFKKLEYEGYCFDVKTIENYLLSLKVKPFVILIGNSGTGKTKLSQLFAQYLNQNDNYKIIPVGANWTENRHVLGYYDIINDKNHHTPAYELIEHSKSESYPHFLILDEMNLSHVERYFADFLSSIESNEKIPMAEEDDLEIPSNLFIIGTVNVDETTYMFSPKVLDRANTIEFETYDAKKYMNNECNFDRPNGRVEYLENVLDNDNISEMNMKELKEFFNDSDFWNELSDEIFKFQDILKKSGFDFGFRVINEIVRFMAVAYSYENKSGEWDWKRYFDAQIKQKMLPKLHGSQKVIGETLNELLEACEEYPSSRKKLKEMIEVLEKQRYVSFIN